MIATLLRMYAMKRVRNVAAFRTFLESLAALLAVVVLHSMAMVWLEGMQVFQAVWFTIITVTTIGYGDVSPQTDAGKAATIILAVGFGLFLFTKVLSDYVIYRAERAARKRAGKWRWKLKNHVLIIGTPAGNPTRFYKGLAEQIRMSDKYNDAQIQLLTTAYHDSELGLPEELSTLGVVHVTGLGTETEDLAAAEADKAAAVIILADRYDDPLCDAISTDIAMRIRDGFAAVGNTDGVFVTEVVNDHNRSRLMAVGAAAAVRPMRMYPEMISRALIAPGAEMMLENLFTAEGDEIVRVTLREKLGRTLSASWADVVCSLVRSGIGTAIAYQGPTGEVVTNPVFGRGKADNVEIENLYIVVKDECENLVKDVVDTILEAASVEVHNIAA